MHCPRARSKSLVGSAIICNLDFDHGLLALASAGQAATVQLGIQPQVVAIPNLPSSIEPSSSSHSLLSTPLDYDAILHSTLPKANLAGMSRRIASAAMQSISADQLRQIGQLITQLQFQSQAIRAASQTLQDRFDLCVKESQAQLKLLKMCKTDLEDLRDSKALPRVIRLLDQQSVVGGRMDKVTRRMTARESLGIGEAEREWFDELERTKVKIIGTEGDEGFKVKVDKVSLGDLLRPLSDDIPRSEHSWMPRLVPSHQVPLLHLRRTMVMRMRELNGKTLSEGSIRKQRRFGD